MQDYLFIIGFTVFFSQWWTLRRHFPRLSTRWRCCLSDHGPAASTSLQKKSHCIKAANCSRLERVLGETRAQQLETDSVSEEVTSAKAECSRFCSSRNDSRKCFLDEWTPISCGRGGWHCLTVCVCVVVLRVEGFYFIFYFLFYQRAIKGSDHLQVTVKKYLTGC